MKKIITLLFIAMLLAGCASVERPQNTAVTSAYTLLTGDDLETPVTILKGKEAGPVIYMVGGLHGDEIAGWACAMCLTGTLPEALATEWAIQMPKEQFLPVVQTGTLYVLPCANAYGASFNKRKTKDDYDLNRAFPGNPEGKDAARLADAIFSDIKEKQPALVIDLHEAKLHTDGKDNLGNTLICNDLEPLSELVLSLLAKSQDGSLPLSAPLSLYDAPPKGSLNKTVSEQLGIPVLTIETKREEALQIRIENQLLIVREILSFYDM